MSLSMFDKMGNTAVPQANRVGMQPNKFNLQMFGSNPSVAQRPAIGFGTPDLQGQVPGDAKAMDRPAPLPGMPMTQAEDPYAKFGPMGWFFQMVDNAPDNKRRLEMQANDRVRQRDLDNATN